MTNLIDKLIAKSWNRLAAPASRDLNNGARLDLGFQVIDGEVKRSRAYLPDSKRAEHLAILGKTGQGKSFFLRYLASQDVHRRRGFVFFDLHGDTMPFLLRLIAGEERRTRTDLSDRLIVIEPADPEFSIGLNVLEAQEGQQNYVQLVEFAQILKARWNLDSFGARTEELLRNSLHVLADNGLTLLELSPLLTSAAFRATCLTRVENTEVLSYFQTRFDTRSEAMQGVFRDAILNKISGFTTDQRFRHILGQQRSGFSLLDAMDRGRWMILNLDKGRLGEQASTLGSLLLTKLKNALFARKRRQLFTLYCDEIQNLVAYDAGLDVLLSEARKFAIGVVTANQFLEQYPPQMRAATQASACSHPLPTDSASAMITDPPYYYSVQYADLSDFFYVWLRRAIGTVHPDLFCNSETPKDEEIIVQSPGHQFAPDGKNNAHYESHMRKAMSEGRRVVAPDGLGVVVFAHTSTTGWESQLQAMIDAGWIITGSWPIDTELANRLISVGRSVLASSVHLVCRPRENPHGSVSTDEIGDWRDVLQELPRRIHEWMPRLAQEGVVGADAIFSCLGPALEIFSRYSRVEKPNGDQVLLKEYLESVWAAVSKEAISMIFAGADTTGFEEDARLTAMWLWTLSPGLSNGESTTADETEDAEEDSDGKPAQTAKLTGFTLEYDAARKIAQGLGAHLELLVNLVEVKGEIARLLPVAERTKALFGKEGTDSPSMKRKKSAQLSLPGLLEELEQEESGWTLQNAAKPGTTTLDRLHQAMILFAAGRGEGLRRFLVDDGVGKDQRFWSLAQSLCALYPSGSDERRWSEGVLARKKGMGL